MERRLTSIYRDLVLADLPAGGTFLEFNEASGTLVDSGGGGHNGTRAFTTDPVYDKPGPFTGSKSLEFSNTNDSAISLGNVFDFNGNQTYTVELWEFGYSQGGGLNYMIDKMRASGVNDGWNLRHDDGNIYWRRMDAAGGADQLAGTVKPPGSWTYWAGTYDSSNLNLYRDAVLNAGPLASTRALAVTTDNLIIGDWSGASGASGINGRIAFVAIYPSVVLTLAQMEAHMEAGLGCVPSQAQMFPHPPLGAPA